MHNPRVNSLKKSVLARFFRHEGEGRMNWRTRSTKYSLICPQVRTSGMTYRTVLTTGRDENTSCRGEWVTNAPRDSCYCQRMPPLSPSQVATFNQHRLQISVIGDPVIYLPFPIHNVISISTHTHRATCDTVLVLCSR